MAADSEDQAFRALIQPGADRLRATGGSCPDSADLVAFHEHRLSSDGTVRIEHHVQACGVCTVLLRRLASADPQASDTAGVWESVRHAFRSPILAYTLVLLLAYPAIKGMLPHAAVQPTPAFLPVSRPAAAYVPSFPLDTNRGTATEPIVLHLAGNQDAFVLELISPLQPGKHYYATISDSSQVVAATINELSAPTSGSLTLLCSRRQLPSSAYTLIISEVASDVRFSYFFRIE